MMRATARGGTPGRRGAALAAALWACLLALVLPGCGGDERGAAVETPGQSQMTLQTAPQVIVDQELLRAVTEAYQRFWQDYAIALGTLDAAPLQGAAAEGALQSLQDYLQGLRNEGKAYLVAGMRHAPLVTALAADEAVVEGTGSLLVTPVRVGTGEPLGDQREQALRYLVRFRPLDGTWKAVAFMWAPLAEGGEGADGEG